MHCVAAVWSPYYGASINVTNFGKIDHLRAFCISRNTDLKYLMHCASPVAQCSHAIYLV